MRRILLGLAGYAALLLVALAAYHDALHQFFIADDFTHLRSLRASGAPFWRYLDPTFAPSDPVTQARYLPLNKLALLFLERRFGLDAAPYHAASIALHAADALLVGHVGAKAFGSKRIGAISALLFATTRVNAQQVCWIGCVPNLVGAALVFGSIALYLRRDRASSVLGPLLLTMSLLCRTDDLVAVAFFVPLWARDVLSLRRREAARSAWLTLAGAALVVALGVVSLRRFPEPHLGFGFEPRRIFAVVAGLFAPWRGPAWGKALVAAAVLAAAIRARDTRILAALWAVALGAMFWAVTVYLPLMPRYLYLYTAAASMVIAALVIRAADRASARLGGAKAAALASSIAVGLWAAWNVRAAQRVELVWLDYLSTPTRQVFSLYQRQRARGATAPLRVRMLPHRLLGDADAAFFYPTIDLVKDGPADVIVDAEAARYARYFGEDPGKAYWYFPWLDR